MYCCELSTGKTNVFRWVNCGFFMTAPKCFYKKGKREFHILKALNCFVFRMLTKIVCVCMRIPRIFYFFSFSFRTSSLICFHRIIIKWLKKLAQRELRKKKKILWPTINILFLTLVNKSSYHPHTNKQNISYHTHTQIYS